MLEAIVFGRIDPESQDVSTCIPYLSRCALLFICKGFIREALRSRLKIQRHVSIMMWTIVLDAESTFRKEVYLIPGERRGRFSIDCLVKPMRLCARHARHRTPFGSDEYFALRARSVELDASGLE